MQRSSYAVLLCCNAACSSVLGAQGACEGLLQTFNESPESPEVRRPALSAGSVRHFPIPGVLTLQGGAREAVIMHVYLRSQPRGDVVVFRGFMFAESVERDWYSLLVSLSEHCNTSRECCSKAIWSRVELQPILRFSSTPQVLR